MDDELLSRLASPEADVFAAAIREAAGRNTDPVRSRLDAIVRAADRGDPIRTAAAESLGKLPDQGGSERLLVLLTEDDPHLRMLGGIGLAHCAAPAAIEPLVTALRDPVNTVRNVAERALIDQMPLVRTHGIDALLTLLADPVPLTRSPAARLIGLTRDRRGLAPLMSILRTDREWLARMWAAKALGDLGCSEAGDLLHERLDRDDKNRVRAAAAESIGKLRPLHGEAWLLHAVEHDDDGGVRKLAGEALRLFGIDLPDPDQDDILDELAED